MLAFGRDNLSPLLNLIWLGAVLLSVWCLGAARNAGLLSFPTRRSSDLPRPVIGAAIGMAASTSSFIVMAAVCQPLDRKSTRLNSSHGYISYAVFCLKKKIGLFRRVAVLATTLAFAAAIGMSARRRIPRR